MTPEVVSAPKPEEVISNAVDKALPLLKMKAAKSFWLSSLMLIAADNRTESGLFLSNSGMWFWSTRDGFDTFDSLDEALIAHAKMVSRSHKQTINSEYLNKNRGKITQRFIKDLEIAVRKLSTSASSA